MMLAPRVYKYVYLSSAKSLGKNKVVLTPYILQICTKEIAVLPELASTIYLICYPLSDALCNICSSMYLTALSLLLPNGLKYSAFAYVLLLVHKLSILKPVKVWVSKSIVSTQLSQLIYLLSHFLSSISIV